MEVNCLPCVVPLLQSIEDVPRHVLTILDIVTASTPLPLSFAAVDLLILQFYATTSGNFVLCTLKRDFVYDGSGGDGV